MAADQISDIDPSVTSSADDDEAARLPMMKKDMVASGDARLTDAGGRVATDIASLHAGSGDQELAIPLETAPAGPADATLEERADAPELAEAKAAIDESQTIGAHAEAAEETMSAAHAPATPALSTLGDGID